MRHPTDGTLRRLLDEPAAAEPPRKSRWFPCAVRAGTARRGRVVTARRWRRTLRGR